MPQSRSGMRPKSAAASKDAGYRLPALQPSAQGSDEVQQPTKREPVAQACHVPPEGQVKFGILGDE